MDPKRVRILAIAVVAVVVVAGVSAYLVYRARTTGSCEPTSTNPLVVDQAEVVGTFDPQSAASTPDWGAVQQVYQTLVMYNQTSFTTYTGLLAKNWSESKDGFHWNFTLRNSIHFSNGDPVNAYVMWYSLYRLLALQGIDQYLLSENFWYPNVGYYSPASSSATAVASLITELNTFNFTSPTAAQKAAMLFSNQSFRALDASTIQLNLGFGYLYNYTTGAGIPYTYLLAEIATPGAAAVDPIVIDQHGGVAGAPSAWMTTNAMGTGPFKLQSFNPVSGYTIVPDAGYWGVPAAATEPWNNNLQPAKTSIEVDFQGDASVNVQNLKTRSVVAASFMYLGPDTIHQLQSTPCVVVTNRGPVFAGAGGSWWVYMNQSTPPFNNFTVREAIVHAINYSQILSTAFGGYAFSWVGPVPPGHPYYNPSNLAPYAYNLTLAKKEMAQSPYPNGFGQTLNFMYLNTGPDWLDTAQLIQADLAQIGISVNPVAITLKNFYEEQTVDPSTGVCLSQERANGGPFPIGLDFYSSDYISPDDWTQQDALSYGSANLCMSGYYNATMDQLVLTATGERNPVLLNNDYARMTSLMYNNYTNAWFAVPELFTASNPLLQGVYPTPMGSTAISTMQWNTVYAT